jgi:hypothetical protein
VEPAPLRTPIMLRHMTRIRAKQIRAPKRKPNLRTRPNQHMKHNVPKNCAIGRNNFDSDSGSFADRKLLEC